MQRADELPAGIRGLIVEESRRCLAALEVQDIGYFVERLAIKDRWRILAHFLDEVSFFDIETAGLEYDDPITVIACWHKGQVHSFVEHENLDDFLDLLDDVQLLSSFNGSTFDVPRVLDAFHIPDLPCPHLDLRWLCYHQQLRGGLKKISDQLGIDRPMDLRHVSGEHAIRLWLRWTHYQDQQAREELVRYCASDVLLLIALADRLVGCEVRSLEELWAKLPSAGSQLHFEPAEPEAVRTDNDFGAGSPVRLRGWKSRQSGRAQSKI